MSRLLVRTAGLAAFFAAASLASAQTPTPTPTPSATPTPTPTSPPSTVPAGQSWTIQNSTAVTGVRIRQAPDGSVWFMTPSNDRIVHLQGNTMTQWQIRADKDIGANPVDFELDGNVIWFTETGESLIDAGKSIYAKLDTSTNELTEWILPISRPAGFYRVRGPDGTPTGQVWIAQSAGVLELFDMNNLTALDYRSGTPVIFAAAMAVGPDGRPGQPPALWIADFGSNRIVRHSFTDCPPGTTPCTDTAWTILDPATGVRLNPSDMKFDEQGFLWITELSGTRVDRFDPVTGGLRVYPGIADPLHLDIFAGRIYVSQETGGNGSVAVLDPNVAPFSGGTLSSSPIELRTPAGGATQVSIRCSVTISPASPCPTPNILTPTTFDSTNAQLAASDLPVTSSTPGILVTGFNSTQAYGLLVDGGAVWVGSGGKLIRLVLQTVGTADDLSVPVALQYGGPTNDQVRVDVTLFNRGNASITGDALFLFSPGSPVPSKRFSVGPGQTVLISDAFAGAPSEVSLLIGPVRLHMLSGQASDLLATVRTARALPSGASFGIAARAQPIAGPLSMGQTGTLFTGHRSSDISIFGFYSPTGANATATLVAPNGSVRGMGAIAIASNVAEEFNPAASFFGVSPEPGDVIRVQVTSGNLQPYVNIQDALTRDLAQSLPVAAGTDLVLPNAGSTAAGAGRTWASGLFLSNPDSTRAANVAATFVPLNGGSPVPAFLSLPAGGSLAFGDVVGDLFHASPAQGAITLLADVPIAAAIRFAAQNGPDQGQYASLAPALDGGAAVPSGGVLAFGLPSTPVRHATLFLVNRGAAGTATITGFDGNGGPAGQLAVPVASGAATRVDRILETLGSAATLGHIRLDASAGMQLYAQIVEVDSDTGDTEAFEPQ